MDTKISALTDGGAVQATDQIPAVRAGANVRVQVSGGGSPVPSDFQPAIVTGNYYYPPHVVINGQGLYGDNLVAFPVWFSYAVTWTRIGFKLTTADAGKSIRLGLYENSASNTPGALVADFGTLALDATGDLELTISQALAANTVYWLAFVANTDPVSPVAACAGMTMFADSGTGAILADSNWTLGSVAAADPVAFSTGLLNGRAFPYAALPDPFGAPTSVFDAPAIWLRKV